MCSRNDDPTTIDRDDDERPAHTHRDDRDATDDCPACAWDIDHLGGAS